MVKTVQKKPFVGRTEGNKVPASGEKIDSGLSVKRDDGGWSTVLGEWGALQTEVVAEALEWVGERDWHAKGREGSWCWTLIRYQRCSGHFYILSHLVPQSNAAVDLLGGPVVIKTLHLQHKGAGVIPGQGTRIPCAAAEKLNTIIIKNNPAG